MHLTLNGNTVNIVFKIFSFDRGLATASFPTVSLRSFRWPGLQIADVAGGSLHAVIGILGAEQAHLNGGTFYDYYETLDGRYLSVGSLEPPFMSGLAAVLELPLLLDEALDSSLSEERQWVANVPLTHKFIHHPLANHAFLRIADQRLYQAKKQGKIKSVTPIWRELLAEPAG